MRHHTSLAIPAESAVSLLASHVDRWSSRPNIDIAPGIGARNKEAGSSARHRTRRRGAARLTHTYEGAHRRNDIPVENMAIGEWADVDGVSNFAK